MSNALDVYKAIGWSINKRSLDDCPLRAKFEAGRFTILDYAAFKYKDLPSGDILIRCTGKFILWRCPIASRCNLNTQGCITKPSDLREIDSHIPGQ